MTAESHTLPLVLYRSAVVVLKGFGLEIVPFFWSPPRPARGPQLKVEQQNQSIQRKLFTVEKCFYFSDGHGKRAISRFCEK